MIDYGNFDIILGMMDWGLENILIYNCVTVKVYRNLAILSNNDDRTKIICSID